MEHHPNSRLQRFFSYVQGLAPKHWHEELEMLNSHGAGRVGSVNRDFIAEAVESGIGRMDIMRLTTLPSVLGGFFVACFSVSPWVRLYVLTWLAKAVRRATWLPVVVREFLSVIFAALGPGINDALEREGIKKAAQASALAAATTSSTPPSGPTTGTTASTSGGPAMAAASSGSSGGGAPATPPTTPPATPPPAAGGTAPPPGGTPPAGGGGGSPSTPPSVAPMSMSDDERRAFGLFENILEIRASDVTSLPREVNSLKWLLRHALRNHTDALRQLPIFTDAEADAVKTEIEKLERFNDRTFSSLNPAEVKERADAIEAVHAAARRYGTFIMELRSQGSNEMGVIASVYLGILDFLDDRVTEEQRNRFNEAANRVLEAVFGSVTVVEVKKADGSVDEIRHPSLLRRIWNLILGAAVILTICFGTLLGGSAVVATLVTIGSGLIGGVIMIGAGGYGVSLLAKLFGPHMTTLAFNLNAVFVVIWFARFLVVLYDRVLVPMGLGRKVDAVDHVDKDGHVVLKTEQVSEGVFRPMALRVALGVSAVALLTNLFIFVPQGALEAVPYGLVVITAWCIITAVEAVNLLHPIFTIEDRRKMGIWFTVRLLGAIITFLVVTALLVTFAPPSEQAKAMSGVQHVVPSFFNTGNVTKVTEQANEDICARAAAFLVKYPTYCTDESAATGLMCTTAKRCGVDLVTMKQGETSGFLDESLSFLASLPEKYGVVVGWGTLAFIGYILYVLVQVLSDRLRKAPPAATEAKPH